jgi:hypothetical protein
VGGSEELRELRFSRCSSSATRASNRRFASIRSPTCISSASAGSRSPSRIASASARSITATGHTLINAYYVNYHTTAFTGGAIRGQLH